MSFGEVLPPSLEILQISAIADLAELRELVERLQNHVQLDLKNTSGLKEIVVRGSLSTTTTPREHSHPLLPVMSPEVPGIIAHLSSACIEANP